MLNVSIKEVVKFLCAVFQIIRVLYVNKIFARPKMAHSDQNNNYCEVLCIYDW